MNLALLRSELTRDEGLRLTAYKDSVGLWTIGVGHLLGESQRMTDITREEAESLLDRDVQIALTLARKIVPSLESLSEARQRALVNMVFNLGNRLAGFKRFLAAIEARDWIGASEEMMDSKWADQVGIRAERLRDMILEG